MTIGAVVLAAGASRRLGRAKQLLPFGGTTLIDSIVGRVCASRCDRVGVVIGAEPGVALALARQPIDLIDNADWAEGLASSLRVAVAWARKHACEALIVTLGDQPALSTSHLDHMCSLFPSQRCIASRYANVLGVPALFAHEHFAVLCTLHGDRGARDLLGQLAAWPLEWPDGDLDVDRPSDLHRLQLDDGGPRGRA